MNIGIVGLGLIGGSLAKSIKNRTAHTVYGLDVNDETMTFARLCGAIDGRLTADTLPGCDMLLLAVRPGDAVAWTREHAPAFNKEAILVDMCGVKRSVCAKLSALAKTNGFRYVGGHPMAGSERGGFVNSREDLFVGASMILTPETGCDLQTLETVKNLFTDIGFANMTYTDPDTHDRVIAYTSQLAHVVSSAYVKSPEAQVRRGFSAGSFRDLTRVARLDEDMWTELMLDDADYLTAQLDVLLANLQAYRDAVAARDGEKLHALLKEGRERKATAGGN